ncbi:MAG: hypothetical protein ACE1ZV_07610, partial [Alphaproteobacteria bacterium]
RVMRLCEHKKIDITLSRLFGNSAKILIVVIVVIITLSNFGIDIAPLVALAGASAFGLSFALAGPLSNYGAGLVIILTRPFVVGDTIKDALSRFDGLAEGAAPQIGIHDFNFGGIVIGLRYWVPSSRYYLTRYAVNQTALAALKAKRISLLPASRAAIVTEMAPA